MKFMELKVHQSIPLPIMNRQVMPISGTGEITTPNAHQNTSDPQTIWVRLENNVTGCYSVGSFILALFFVHYLMQQLLLIILGFYVQTVI